MRAKNMVTLGLTALLSGGGLNNYDKYSKIEENSSVTLTNQVVDSTINLKRHHQLI